MPTAEPAETESAIGSTVPDREGDKWLVELKAGGDTQDAAIGRLHATLLRVARAELSRRAPRWHLSGPEIEDLAFQATADAVIAILEKLDQFRRESRFTTWAFRFVILEVSSKLGRHFWTRPRVELTEDAWDRLPDRFGLDPACEAEWRDLMGAVRRAVETVLTPHQRRIFAALVLDAVPLDALVVELGSNRNAIYKTMFDARRKLRAALVANGYLSTDETRPV